MGQRLWQSGFLLFTLGALWACLALASIARGQEVPSPAEPTVPAPAVKKRTPEPLLPGETSPPVYYLPDKDGNLVAVPGFTLEAFTALFKLRNQLAQETQKPPYSLQELTLSGSAAGPTAELVAEYKVTVLEKGWVGVPLRLNTAVLREPAFEGPGEHVLDFKPERDGYVVWIRSDADAAHRITFKLLAPIVQIGPESYLRLSLPRAAVSQLQLQVPFEHTVAKVSEGSTLGSVRTLEGGKSELKMIGIGGEFEVAWHAAESQVARLPTVLEASGAQLIRMNGRSVNSDVELTVRSLAGEFDRFQVRLPPGADYVNTTQAGMSLVAIATAAEQGKLYEVKLEKKTTGPVKIRLVTERTHNSPQNDVVLQLAGFDVVGAVRQWGTVAVQVEGNWQVLWGETNHVEKVDELRGQVRRDDLAAGFEYVQPYSLTARVVPQKTRVRVEPEYVLLVGSDEARLRAKLKYTIRGAKVRSLELELPGWEVDSMGPANLVDVDAAVANTANPVAIPLVQASSGELELTLEAHQKIAAGAESVTLELPRLKGEAAPANLAVLPDDNIELTLQPDASTALAPQAVRPQIKLPERQQDPLAFRTTGSEAKFVASVKVHEQAISAALATQLDVDERETRVDQRIVFQIAYQPTDHLILGVPRAVRSERLNITLDGQQLLPLPVRERVDGDAEVTPIRVALPGPRIGRCELKISYVERHERLSSTASTLVIVPLVIPGEGQLTGNELVVVPKAGISVNYPPGPWAEDARHRPAINSNALTLSARRAISEVSLGLSSKEQAAQSATTVEQAWIQTRLIDAQRQDRAIYRLTTSEPRLQLSLPTGVEMGTIELEIDGRSVTPESVRQRDVIVSLSGAGRNEHLLEVRYHFSDRRPLGRLTLESPQIQSARWVQQLYWQLILPASEHILLVPDHFTPEYRWIWSNWAWQREPSLDQGELESWINTPPNGDRARLADEGPEQSALRQPAVSRSANRYLFSAIGNVEPLEVYSINRARLVLWSSLPLLVGGLILIYFPVARHPAWLFILAVLVAADIFVDPDTALLLAQTSSLGLVLALVAALLARVTLRPATAAIPVRGSSKAIERPATEMYQRAPASVAQPSTSTEPLVPTSPESES